MTKRAFDLSQTIKGLPRNHDLTKAVKRFHAVLSVSLDLETAHTALENLITLRKKDEAPFDVVAALLTHAIIIYSRASHTTAIDRYNVGVTGAYTKEQLKAHKSIVHLRDKVLAHFGTGEGWHDDRVVYLELPEGTLVTGVHRRTNSDSLVVETLKNLLEVAIPHVKKMHALRADELNETIFRLSPGIGNIILDNPFDLHGFYKDMPGAEELFWKPKPFSRTHDEVSEPRSPN